MPNEEWGTKRICPTTGKRFYDLNKDPILCIATSFSHVASWAYLNVKAISRNAV